MTTTTEEEQDRIRAQAEARRQRILAKSNERMNRVSGGPAVTATTGDDKNDEAGGDSSAAATTGEEGGAAAVAESPSPTKKSKGSAGAARLAAARRRRFNKSKKAAAATEETNTETDAAATATTPAVAVAAESSSAPSSVPQAEQTPKPVVTKEVETVTPITTTPTAADAATTSTVTTTTPTAESTGNKKKYKGVAKVRWEKAQKKKQQEQLDAIEASKTQGKNARNINASFDTPTPQLIYNKKKQPKPILPIVLHLLCIILLLCVGIDIGWQQNQKQPEQLMKLHIDYAPKQFIGLQTLNRKLGIFSLTSSSVEKDALFQNQFESTAASSSSEGGEESEFHVDEEEKSTTIEGADNIDPLFGVDLNKILNQAEANGSMNGLFIFMARLAIKVHQTILYIMYYYPMNIITSIMNLPNQLLSFPPTLCIIALILRQMILSNKVLFGTNNITLPTAKQDDIRKAKSGVDVLTSSKGMNDIITMIKTSAINLLSNTFPTAVNLYTIWNQLRSDMYILFCGVCLGIAISTHQSIQFMQQQAAASTTTESAANDPHLVAETIPQDSSGASISEEEILSTTTITITSDEL